MAEKSESHRTLIGVLSSHEDPRRHDELVTVLDETVEALGDQVELFAFVFTGGTYNRILHGKGRPDGAEKEKVSDATRDALFEKCGVIRLPSHDRGGVVLLTHLVVERRLGILWPFLTPVTGHWLQVENVALLRLSDYWHVTRLLNAHSIERWLSGASQIHVTRYRQPWKPAPLEIRSLNKEERCFEFTREPDTPTSGPGVWRLQIPRTKPEKDRPRREEPRRLALISHDEMKDRMVEFAIDYERELADRFDKIVTTGTTGSRIKDAAPTLADKIFPYHSGPKGGDMQIATEIILGLIDSVIFFVDPLRPHPHPEDIRVVFGACMMQDVQMLTNERQAREWMDWG